MDDFLDVLFNYVTEERLPTAISSPAYLVRYQREEAALNALLGTLSKEQHALYRRYEDAHNAFASLELQQLFRETFALTRDIYR